MYNDIIANSARVAEGISCLMVDKNQREAEHRAKLEAGAEADIAQRELLQGQLEALREQNELLSENYNKLKEMYEVQRASYISAEKDLEQSRRINKRMMTIATISMIAAIASPIVTILVSG